MTVDKVIAKIIWLTVFGPQSSLLLQQQLLLLSAKQQSFCQLFAELLHILRCSSICIEMNK